METVPNTTTPVLILKLEHYGSLGIMRSLGRLGVPVYGIDRNPSPIAASSRYCLGAFSWDVERNHPAETLDFLLTAASAIGRKAILVPTSDETALFVANHRRDLAGAFRFHQLPPSLVAALGDKRELHRLSKRLGAPTPEAWFPASWGELRRLSAEIGYPVVLKGIHGHAFERRTGVRMTIVEDRPRLLETWQRLADPITPDVMIQEYIPGDDDSAWLYNATYNERSDCLVAFTGRKLRLNPVYTGMTSYGACRWNRELADGAETFLRAIGYRGIVDMDFRFDARDGRYKLLDVNPRIGASFRMFVGQNGIDVVRAHYCDLTGQPVTTSHPPDGRTWMVEDKDLLSAWRYLRHGKLRPGRWIRSLGRVSERAYFAADDWSPSWRLWSGHLSRAMSKIMDGCGRGRPPERMRSGIRYDPTGILRDGRVDPVRR